MPWRCIFFTLFICKREKAWKLYRRTQRLRTNPIILYARGCLLDWITVLLYRNDKKIWYIVITTQTNSSKVWIRLPTWHYSSDDQFCMLHQCATGASRKQDQLNWQCCPDILMYKDKSSITDSIKNQGKSKTQQV